MVSGGNLLGELPRAEDPGVDRPPKPLLGRIQRETKVGQSQFADYRQVDIAAGAFA